MCIKRDNSYDFLDLTKPVVDSSNRLVCENAETKLCLADTSATSVNQAQVFCIPSASDCPVTSITYPANALVTDLTIHTDASYGTPIQSLQYSEGPPCINSNEYNTKDDKKEYDLFPSVYYSGCTSDVDDEKNLPNAEKVENFPQFNYYTVLE
jgi:hypothetical protein